MADDSSLTLSSNMQNTNINLDTEPTLTDIRLPDARRGLRHNEKERLAIETEYILARCEEIASLRKTRGFLTDYSTSLTVLKMAFDFFHSMNSNGVRIFKQTVCDSNRSSISDGLYLGQIQPIEEDFDLKLKQYPPGMVFGIDALYFLSTSVEPLDDEKIFGRILDNPYRFIDALAFVVLKPESLPSDPIRTTQIIQDCYARHLSENLSEAPPLFKRCDWELFCHRLMARSHVPPVSPLRDSSEPTASFDTESGGIDDFFSRDEKFESTFDPDYRFCEVIKDDCFAVHHDDSNPIDKYIPRLGSNDSNLTHLRLPFCPKFGVEGTKRLAAVLATNSILRLLDLSGNEIKFAGICELATALRVNTTLEALSLSSNDIGADGMKMLATALINHQSLTNLSLRSNSLKLKQVRELTPLLASNGPLIILDLSMNDINDEGLECLAMSLETNTTLIHLFLGGNCFGAIGAKQLAQTLAINTTLRMLDLSGAYWGEGSMGDEGASCLAKALSVNSSLRTLNLSDHKIRSTGAKCLAEALQTNSTLTDLNISSNQIGDMGVSFLTLGLSDNHALEELNLSGNEIELEGSRHLSQFLAVNTTLQYLHLRDNRLGDEGTMELSIGLARNIALTTLDLSGNDICDEGASKLLRANVTLKTIHLGSNNISAPLLSQILSRSQESREENQIIDQSDDDFDPEENWPDWPTDSYQATPSCSSSSTTTSQSLDKRTLKFISRIVANDPNLVSLTIGDGLKMGEACGKIGCDLWRYFYLWAERLSTNSVLTELFLLFISANSMIFLAKVLTLNSAILDLQLAHCNISSKAAMFLGRALTVNTALTSLSLQQCIQDKGMMYLGQGLIHNASLKTIELGQNEFGDEGIASLAEVLAKNTTLTKLDLSNHCTPRGFARLGDALVVNTTLLSLSFRWQELEILDIIRFSISLGGNTTVTISGIPHLSVFQKYRSLVLNDATILELDLTELVPDIDLLVPFLARNTSLESLNLSNNNFSIADLVKIGNALSANSTLLRLFLQNNNIGNEGATRFAKAIAGNTKLSYLCLRSNRISTCGVASISETMTALNTLRLAGNSIGLEAPRIFSLLALHPSLRVLDLVANGIRDEEVTAIAEMLALNTTLKQLGLNQNEIGPAGAEKLAEALNVNHTLESASIGNNDIGVEGIRLLSMTGSNESRARVVFDKNQNYLLRLLSSDPELTSLDISGSLQILEALQPNTTVRKLNLSAVTADDFVVRLGDLLFVNSTITNLNFVNGYNNKIEYADESFERILDALVINSTLLSLNLGSYRIRKTNLKKMATVLRLNTVLTSLCVRFSKILDSEAEELAESFIRNTTLRELNLQYSKVRDSSTIGDRIMLALAQNVTLSSLTLSLETLRHQDFLPFTDALAINTVLSTLAIQETDIEIEALTGLSMALKTNTTLTSLLIDNAKIGNEGISALIDGLATNNSLTSVRFYDNGIDSIGEARLATVLQLNTTLTSLDLESNEISTLDDLPASLTNNTTLKTLDLSSNDISEHDAGNLVAALVANSSLTKLCLYENPILEGNGEEMLQSILSTLTNNRENICHIFR